MKLSEFTAISPIDGRYRTKTHPFAKYLSEFGLIKYRVFVEIEYFIGLVELPLPQLHHIKTDIFPSLRAIFENFSEKDAIKIKEIEKITNHDVKAVEYFLKEKWEKLGLNDEKEFIHFGLTSQDINNTAIPYSYKLSLEQILFPALQSIIKQIEQHANEYASLPLLARTHGQPATPTTLGKEWEVFSTRLNLQLEKLKELPITAKLGGATGNFNAHYVTYSHIDWHQWGKDFVEQKLNLKRSYPTTQIEHYDFLAASCDNLKRINTILIDFSRDIWHYISQGYYAQKINKNEVGSSAMPHKVNPIDFENAEGNLGIANALFNHLSEKLPISRLQRDLTDSTVLRNLGVPLAHCLIACLSLKKGIAKLKVNHDKITQDLEDNWAVVAEAIQTILRRENYPSPYETLKQLTRTNEKITSATIKKFIENLDISAKIKGELFAITPFNYTGKK